jgi:hypothetical protein
MDGRIINKNMRIDYKILKKIEKEYGSDDFQVGPSDEGMFGSIVLRFGYWRAVPLDSLQKTVGERYTVEEVEYEDEDTGWLYHYILK